MRPDTVWRIPLALLIVLIGLPVGAQEAEAQFTLRATSQSLTLDDLLRLAPDDLNGFWRQEFGQNNWAYKPPPYLQGYDTAIPTPCGPALLGNAFYCPGDHNIYYHRSFIQKEIFDSGKYGDFGTLAVLAHEWAHAVQTQLEQVDKSLVSSIRVNRELQADCFAGAYARYLDAGQSTSLILEEGDLEEGMTLFYDIGDDLPWFDPDAHGSPHKRKLNFHVGLKEGVTACFRDIEYRNHNEIYRIEYPRTWRIQHTEDWNGDTYYIKFLMAAPRAERADINGYMSEGIRINMRLPQKGKKWTEAYQAAWVSGRIRSVLAANPRFHLVDSSTVSFDEFKGMRYRIAGSSEQVSESEQTTILVAADPRVVIQVEMASPASRYSYYQDRLQDLFYSFWVNSLVAPQSRQ